MTPITSDFADYNEDIAIVGMSGRFPGAPDLDIFWDNLRTGVESVAFFSDKELAEAGVTKEQRRATNYVGAGAILADVESFDAPFFAYTPAEAEIIDPQQRLFLECAWTALEHAGYDTHTYADRIGVYAGSGMSTYLLFHLYPRHNLQDIVGSYQLMIANDKDFLPTRVSYKLNLRGPSIAVQTACSTSLVAVHLACQSLLNGECDLALAGGVSISLPRKVGYVAQPGMILSPDGHCRAFDAKARGTVRGDGVGVVVLQRLQDALAEGSTIHAVIKATAINNDGAMKIGYTAPRMESQYDVIVQAQTLARVNADTISYIEAHGTGTELGDPIEIEALTQAFRVATEKKQFCALGSVKTNIGHLDAAAGIAGLLKTVLMLKAKQLAPSLHFEQPNPQIDFAHSPFYVNTSLRPWPTEGTPRRAGVSSFGIGGTNAHVILEEAPIASSEGATRSAHLFVLSAKTPTALRQNLRNLATFLHEHPSASLADIAYTLQVGRRAFGYRQALVGQQHEEIIKKLEQLQIEQLNKEAREQPTVIFLFPGQGSQYVNMGRQVYEQELLVRQIIDECASLLKQTLGRDLRSLIFAAKGEEAEAEQQLRQTRFAQPTLFVLEYALAKQWEAWGVEAEAMLGHSVGEYVAACLSGVMSLKDALHVVAKRGAIMQEQAEGAMLAIELPEQDVRGWIEQVGELSVAAINGPESCVVSGRQEQIEELRAQLEQQGKGGHLLETSHAFHSMMMEEAAERFVQEMRHVSLAAPQRRYISNVTGKWIREEEARDPQYWGRHLRETVRFGEGVQMLKEEYDPLWLEVGPGRTLSTLLKQHLSMEKRKTHVINSLPHPQEKQADFVTLLQAAGKLWCAGESINWQNFYAQESRLRVPLPTYPFERQRYWVEYLPPSLPSSVLPLLGKKPDRADWFYQPVWQEDPFVSRDDAEKDLTPASWLIFVDASGLGERLAEKLMQMQQQVICVYPGDVFASKDAQTYTLNPLKQEDYFSLCKSLVEWRITPKTILHCWNVGEQTSIDRDVQLGQSFYSLLYLTQALVKQGQQSVQLLIVSTNAHLVTEQEVIYPERTLMYGASTVIAQEHLNITCRTIDLPFPLPDNWEQQEELLTALIEERKGKQSQRRIAYREGTRLVQSYLTIRLSAEFKKTKGLRQQGVYLITGGLGKIGLVLAAHLAKTVQARLVLVSRSALPERGEWQTLCASHDESNVLVQKLRRIQAIEQAGGQVLSIQADVANEAQMQEVIKRTHAEFGALHGVIHAAGVTSLAYFKAIRSIDHSECEAHFQAKVYGTQILATVLQGYQLDFCMLFSSLSSILGGMSYVAYAAANSFLDGFAYGQRNNAGTPWISVDWDTWDMPRSASGVSGKSIAPFAMTLEEACDVFTRFLAYDYRHVVNSTGDLSSRVRQWVDLETLRKQADDGSPHPANLPLTEYEQQIALIWQRVLGIEQIGLHDNFFELGGTSLIGIQLVAQLKEKLGIEVSPVSLFEAPTVSALATLLKQETGPSSYAEVAQRGAQRKERLKKRQRQVAE